MGLIFLRIKKRVGNFLMFTDRIVIIMRMEFRKGITITMSRMHRRVVMILHLIFLRIKKRVGNFLMFTDRIVIIMRMEFRKGIIITMSRMHRRVVTVILVYKDEC